MGGRSRPIAFSRSADDRATFFVPFFGRSKKGTPGAETVGDVRRLMAGLGDDHRTFRDFMSRRATTLLRIDDLSR
jgi:hypothetical protein